MFNRMTANLLNKHHGGETKMDGPRLNQKMSTLTIPDRIKRLPISPDGYPVPWFVVWYNDGEPSEFGEGVPDFRVADPRKLIKAVKQNLCWICGEPLGKHRVFTIGPMCSINRTISEPPQHRECAEFSVQACPFLSNPRMRRNAKDIPEQHQEAAGIHIARNPGVMCLWETKQYHPFRTHTGNDGILFRLGDPERVDWWAHGRPATREEVLASINSGLPLLEEIAKQEGPTALAALYEARDRVMPLVPA
jgi:hypothetical protein